MATRSNTSASIFFASIPDFKNLCSVTLHLQDTSQTETSKKWVGSQPQILKCRELIFVEPSILASPSLQQEGHIYVILEQSFWKSGHFQAKCSKMGIVVNKPMRVISAVFQACLAYTIRARLAPLWNKAGNWYLQGRDFILAPGRIPAVDMELNVTEAEICLALRPLTIKLPQCSISDFEVCQPVLQEFFLSQTNVVSEYSIDSKWCFVLPSLKKGKIVSISHEIPETSPFKTYKDIRRYWKNAYGYRLPESNNGVLYYNIYFPAIGPTLFSYPQYCIRKQDPILQARVDPSPILDAFLNDLQHKLPSICGTALKVTPKAQYTSTGLYPSRHEESKLSQLTLSCTPPPNSVRRIPTRHLAVQGYTISSNHSQSQPVANLTSSAPYPLPGTVGNYSVATQPPVWQTVNTSQAASQRKPEQMYPSSQPSWGLTSTQHSVQTQQSASFNPAQFLSTPDTSTQSSYAALYKSYGRRPVGSATRSDILTNPYGPSVMSDRSAPPMAPVPQSMAHGPPFMTRGSSHMAPVSPHTTHASSFMASIPQSIAPVSQSMAHGPPHMARGPSHTAPVPPHTTHAHSFMASMAPISQSIAPVSPHMAPFSLSMACGPQPMAPVLQSITPVSMAHVPLSIAPVPSYISPPMASIPQRIFPRFISKQPKSTPHSSIHRDDRIPRITPTFHAARKPTSQPKIPRSQTNERIVPPSTSQINIDTHNKQPATKPTIAPSFSRKTSSQVTKQPSIKKKTQLTLDGVVQKLPRGSPHTKKGCNKTTKRKTDNNSGDGAAVAKKPRAKPKVQDDVDVQSLALNDQLSKVNTVTLATWLKGKGISVKAKEKKADLIQKVAQFIHANSIED